MNYSGSIILEKCAKWRRILSAVFTGLNKVFLYSYSVPSKAGLSDEFLEGDLLGCIAVPL